jgi:hypothetical protein
LVIKTPNIWKKVNVLHAMGNILQSQVSHRTTGSGLNNNQIVS